VAGQVRAELARQGHSIADLADCLGVTPHTAGRRLSGRTDFTAVELVQIAGWLGVHPAEFLPAEQRGAA
jgi:transcriptional regulator with XRE-family HTH domain